MNSAIANIMGMSVVAVLMAAVPVHADDAAKYPEKPVSVIVPWPPGLAPDVGVRVLINALTKHIPGTFQTINRAGAQGVIGTAEVAQAAPNGYTLGAITIGPIITQVLTGDAPYKIDDLQPVALFNTLPLGVWAKADFPANNLKELAAYAKANPGKVTLGHPGRATVPTQSVLRAAKADGYELKEIAFNPVTQSTLQTGDADIVILTTPTMLPYFKAGQVKCLAILAPSGFPSVPGCKTPAEQGYGFKVSVWNGMFVPKNTPPAIVAKLAKAIEASMQEPEMKEYAEKTGTILEFVGPAAAKLQIAEEEKGLRDIMTSLGMVKK